MKFHCSNINPDTLACQGDQQQILLVRQWKERGCAVQLLLTAAIKWMCKEKYCKVVKYTGSAVLRSVVNTLKNSSFRWT